MAEQGQKASLRDVINYTPEEYFTPAEIALIRNTFKDSPALIKVLRKVLIPTINDPELPIEELAKDTFMVGRDYASIPESELKSIVLARQEVIKFVLGGLIHLKQMANSEDLTDEQKKEVARKNSLK